MCIYKVSIAPCRHIFLYHNHRRVKVIKARRRSQPSNNLSRQKCLTTHPSPAEATLQPATFADIDDTVAVFNAAAPLDQTIPYPRAQSPTGASSPIVQTIPSTRAISPSTDNNQVLRLSCHGGGGAEPGRCDGMSRTATSDNTVLSISQGHQQQPEKNESWKNAICSRNLVWDI